jgi:hypothetical protein
MLDRHPYTCILSLSTGEADAAAKARKRAYLGIKEDGSGWAVAEEEGAKSN